MHRLTFSTLAIAGLLICLLGIGSAQVTFSKGWGPGKRSLFEEPLNCKDNAYSLITSYYRLIYNLKQLIRCESQERISIMKPEETRASVDGNVFMSER